MGEWEALQGITLLSDGCTHRESLQLVFGML